MGPATGSGGASANGFTAGAWARPSPGSGPGRQHAAMASDHARIEANRGARAIIPLEKEDAGEDPIVYRSSFGAG